jgi:hypothetical protein
MAAQYQFAIDATGALAQARAEIGSLPAKVTRAKGRALRKLMTWLQRQVLREAAAAAGVTQKALKAALRYRATRSAERIDIWIGTNPIAAHHLGTVRWTRRMRGARVGRRLFPGSFAVNGPRTGGHTVVFERVDARRYPIAKVMVPIDAAIRRRVAGMTEEIAERFARIMTQELRYALTVEASR